MTDLQEEPHTLRDYFGKIELNQRDIEELFRDYYDARDWEKGKE